MELVLIAAVAANNVIGKDNKIPWHFKEDIQRFRQLTMGHPILMGRKTFDSLPDRFRPLPGRLNVVLTRNAEYRASTGVVLPIYTPARKQAVAGVVLYSSLDEALQRLQDNEQVYVIGGEQVYQQAMPLAQRLEITQVHKDYAGDAFFPTINPEEWRRSMSIKSINNDNYSFITYRRR